MVTIATYIHRHQSIWIKGIPPPTVEDPLTPSESNYPSSGNQSPRTNTGSVSTSHDSSLPGDFYLEGFIPPYNPSITNLLGPLLILVSLIPPISFIEPILTIPSMINESWDFVDTFGPPPPPQLTVSTPSLMAKQTIPTMSVLSTIVTPITSGTQYILVSSLFVSALGPSESTPYSARYRARYSTVSMSPFSNPFGWNPLFSSKLKVQMNGGIIPNMHIPSGNIIVPPPFTRQQGQSLIDMNPPYVSQGPMGNYVASEIPQ